VDNELSHVDLTLSGTVQGLQIKWFSILNSDERHRRTDRSLGDGLCVPMIVLMQLRAGLDVKGRQKARVTTVLHAKATNLIAPPHASRNDTRFQIRGETQQTNSLDMIAENNRSNSPPLECSFSSTDLRNNSCVWVKPIRSERLRRRVYKNNNESRQGYSFTSQCSAIQNAIIEKQNAFVRRIRKAAEREIRWHLEN